MSHKCIMFCFSRLEYIPSYFKPVNIVEDRNAMFMHQCRGTHEEIEALALPFFAMWKAYLHHCSYRFPILMHKN